MESEIKVGILITIGLITVLAAIGFFAVWYIWRGAFIEHVSIIPDMAVNLSAIQKP